MKINSASLSTLDSHSACHVVTVPLAVVSYNPASSGEPVDDEVDSKSCKWNYNRHL